MKKFYEWLNESTIETDDFIRIVKSELTPFNHEIISTARQLKNGTVVVQFNMPSMLDSTLKEYNLTKDDFGKNEDGQDNYQKMVQHAVNFTYKIYKGYVMNNGGNAKLFNFNASTESGIKEGIAQLINAMKKNFIDHISMFVKNLPIRSKNKSYDVDTEKIFKFLPVEFLKHFMIDHSSMQIGRDILFMCYVSCYCTNDSYEKWYSSYNRSDQINLAVQNTFMTNFILTYRGYIKNSISYKNKKITRTFDCTFFYDDRNPDGVEFSNVSLNILSEKPNIDPFIKAAYDYIKDSPKYDIQEFVDKFVHEYRGARKLSKYDI